MRGELPYARLSLVPPQMSYNINLSVTDNPPFR